MGNSLHIECYSGASGDMIVAALIDLGVDENNLLAGLDSLNIDGYKIEISRILKNDKIAVDFNVILDDNIYPNKSQNFERNLYDIYNIIDNSLLSDNAKKLSKKIFDIKARAEAKAHNVKIENVFFHEKGAVDSIIDIVSASICIDLLNIKKVSVAQIYDGSGTIRCRCGLLSVPVPAVVNIVNEYNLDLKVTEINGEMVTPTGAAIIAAINTNYKLPDNYEVVKIGLGAGKRIFPNEGLLRAFLIK